MRSLLIAIVICSPIFGQQIMDQQRIAAYKRVLPKTSDPLLREVFDSPDTIWYTSSDMRPMFQMFQTRFPTVGIQGVHPISFNPSVEGDPIGHANNEYPWKPSLGGGSHDAANLRTAKAFLLPRDDQGNLLPVVIFGERPVRWCFPNDTMFVELAWLKRGSYWSPVEIRLRKKEPNDWRTEKYLPYQDRDDLVSFVSDRDVHLAVAIQNGKKTRTRIQDDHPRKAIDSEAIMQQLPSMSKTMVTAILSREFVPTAGYEYAEDADGPTTEDSFSIRPKGDLTANHGSGERNQCTQCHDTIGRHARVFDSQRGWYGTVRGSSGIFSWHPWDNNGNLRQKWLQQGIVARYALNKHPSRYYMQDKFLYNEIRRGVD